MPLVAPRPARPRLVLFDPFSGGHHGDHLAWLAEAWRARAVPGHLVLALAPGVLRERPDLRDLAGPTSAGLVTLDALSATEPLQATPSLAASARLHVRLLSGALRRHAPERVTAMYLDHAQPALALRRRPGPTRFSGLLFRPDLHLPPEPGLRARLRRLRKRALLQATLRAPGFETLFTLDPTAVPAIQALAPHRTVRAVPDPAHLDAPSASPVEVRARYGIGPERRLLVLPGALGARKGIFATLSAVARLPVEPQAGLALVFAGEVAPGDAQRFEVAFTEAQATTEALLVWDRRFLPGPDLQALVAAADVVLAPYQHHIGSSGVVMRAAAAGRPVLAQAEGLIGWQVRAHGLGRTVPSGNVPALAAALAAVAGAPEAGFDAARARAFAAAHTVDAYADAVLGGLSLA